MYPEEEREGILDKLVHDKIWYWGRFSPADRHNYLARRVVFEVQIWDHDILRSVRAEW
jgi:hypothetical protein